MTPGQPTDAMRRSHARRQSALAVLIGYAQAKMTYAEPLEQSICGVFWRPEF